MMNNNIDLPLSNEFVDLLPEVVFECRIDGTITYVNNHAFEKFKYTKEDYAKGVNSAQMLIPADRSRIKDNIAKLILGEKASGNEYTALRKDNTKFPVVIFSSVIFKGKIPIGLRGIIIDITGRKQAEERFRLAAGIASDLIYEWDVLGDSLQWYGDIDKALGFNPGELSMTLKAWLERIHPEDLAKLRNSVDLHRTSKEKIYEEYRVKKKDGTWLNWVDRAVPILNEKGKPVRWIGVCIDVTKQRRGENALRESEDRWRSLTQNLPDHVFTLDKDLNITFCNFAFPGLTIGDMLEKQLYTFTVPKHQKEIKAIQNNVLNTGDSAGYETEYETKEGRKIYYETRLVPTYLNGEIIGLLLTSRDVTAHKIAEDSARKSLREKEVLLKEIHHRVKNNMQIISSLLHLQQDWIQDKKDQEIIKESQNRIRSMALIHEKLYQSKDFSNVDFGRYINNFSLHLYHAYKIDSERIKLIVKVQDVQLDVNHAIPCGLILNELVSNALKHAFPRKNKGEVRIKLTECKSGRITLAVSDNGVGIKPSTNFTDPDTLGLQLINDLVKQLQGSLKLDRKEGTSVKITFQRKGR